MAKLDEIILWEDRGVYAVKYLPDKGILRYDITIPLKQLEKGYIRSKSKQLEGLA